MSLHHIMVTMSALGSGEVVHRRMISVRDKILEKYPDTNLHIVQGSTTSVVVNDDCDPELAAEVKAEIRKIVG